MGYRVKTFKGRDLSVVGNDIQYFLNISKGIRVISLNHSSYSRQGGDFFSAMLVYELDAVGE